MKIIKIFGLILIVFAIIFSSCEISNGIKNEPVLTILVAPNLISPSNNERDIKIDINLIWNKVNISNIGTVKYSVYLGTTNPPVDKVSISKTDTIFKPTLNLNTTYYWKISAEYENGNVKESDIRSFSTIVSTSNSMVYIPRITDLQRDNLKGKVATVLKNGNKKTYNTSGFIIDDSSSTYQNTYEYNSSNLKTKETKKSITNGSVNSTEVLTSTYDDMNRLVSRLTTVDGVETINAKCVINGSTGICTVISKEYGTYKDTVIYNDNNSIIKYINPKIDITTKNYIGSTIAEYDDNFQIISLNTKLVDTRGIVNYKTKVVYNSNYQITNYQAISSVNAESNSYDINNTYEYGADGFVSKEIKKEKDGTVKLETTFTYVLDATGNWIKKTESGSLNIENRSINYY